MDINRINDDLEKLVSDCNQSAQEAALFDPMQEIHFILESPINPDNPSRMIRITRNSGGSPESDYIIEDEVKITLLEKGQIEAHFYREMIKQEQLSTKGAATSWPGILKDIKRFCMRGLSNTITDSFFH